jgi:hypothetical protein
VTSPAPNVAAPAATAPFLKKERRFEPLLKTPLFSFILFLLLSDLCSSKPSFRSVSKFEQIAWGWMVEFEVLPLANPRGKGSGRGKGKAKVAANFGLVSGYWTVTVTEVE